LPGCLVGGVAGLTLLPLGLLAIAIAPRHGEPIYQLLGRASWARTHTPILGQKPSRRRPRIDNSNTLTRRPAPGRHSSVIGA
jgi:hypothetical protein